MKQNSAFHMKRFASVSFALLLGIAFGAPAQMYGQCSKSNAQNCAYVTDGAGGNVYAVDRTTPLGSVTKIQSISATLNDIRVATDNMLYVTSNSAIFRSAENGSGKVVHIFDATTAIPGPFNGVRFSAFGDAYVNTPAGVYRIGPDGNGKHLVEIASAPFPTPVQVTDAACSSSAGGLAVSPTGDLYIACNTGSVNEVLFCPAVNGVAGNCTGTGATQVLTTTPAITGLAVDASANVLVASGSTVTKYNCSAHPCISSLTPVWDFGTDLPAYLDTAPYPAGFPPSQAGGTFPCNSGAVTVFVSTGDASGKNGKAWRLDTVDPTHCLTVAPVLSSVSISSSKPAVGMGISSASRTLTKTFPNSINNDFSEIFDNGPFSIQITNLTVNSGCNLSLTAQRESAAALDAILAKTSPPSRSISFFGEQSWRTSFHGGFPASGCTTSGDSHIGILGALQYLNPWIVLIDDATGKATLDPIPSVYPQFPLPNVPGDPIKITNSGLFTTNARIVLVDRGFTVNSGFGYHFDGFLSPANEPTPDPTFAGMNTINAGKSFALKFSLDVNGTPISNSQGAKVVTGLSAARLTCDASAGTGCPNYLQLLINPEGNSATPPSFNFASGQFHFNLDTNQPDGTKWCNGTYEATANSDSFSPHTIYFLVVGAPAYPSCF